MREGRFSSADRAYIGRDYFSLEELCAGRPNPPAEVRGLIARGVLPAASYVLDDGTEMFPADYFVLPDQAGGSERLREHFEARYRAIGGDPAELDEDWRGYVGGVYGTCLRHATPETIVRKGQLVACLERLLAGPEPESGAWRARLRREVWELDALERELSPDHDRSARFPVPPSRDRLIATARAKYPEVFATSARAR